MWNMWKGFRGVDMEMLKPTWNGMEWIWIHIMDPYVDFVAAEETQFEEPSHFKSGIDCGWAKLEDYYVKSDRTPVYRAALALHPSYGYDYFERHWKTAMDRPQWYNDMQSAVGSLFGEYARQAEVEAQTQAGLLEGEVDEIEADVNDYSSFGKRSIRSLNTQRKKVKAVSELDIFQTRPIYAHDLDVADPLEWWNRHQLEYPVLYRMALDLFSIPGMSSECERAFSQAKKMITDERNRLAPEVVEADQLQKHQVRATVTALLRQQGRERHTGSFIGASGQHLHFKYINSIQVNQRWCIDGHDKLKAYGFEIYAAIDAYSRNIIWFYVGHSATTALSVLKQYLAACDTYGFRPWFLPADRGSETPLVAAAHWNFALAAGGCVEWNGQVFQQGKRLKDSYKAAPSTKNVKIEGWWERMLHVCSRQWVDYFGELARDGDFDGSMLEDQIAIYAVFEGVLRQELFDFVEAWNLHKIRLQKNRPHVVHGQPWMNYHYPDPDKACNWGIPIDRPVLGEMLRPLAGIDISTCLEPETKEWCRQGGDQRNPLQTSQQAVLIDKALTDN
ncbi:hypothetical protein BFJ65_g17683 [Fusarium oxysporum f. sp. cepae]|uniref:Uncharacterized protein n=1 Tax=Fusarium oxysporum f. sp. cepae TaxID=396571 RepID=A0A3L6MTD6_FUSOX|nr:hypothetical protein BFJ65_g17683 [Fusarium oxysporum f. sp. cepae]